MESLIVHTDGGCRSNPGPGAWAFVLHYGDGTTKGYSGFLPHCTNNVAEYRGLEAACLTICNLDNIKDLHDITILSDSMLVVEQINKRWQVKDLGLKPYFQSAFNAFSTLSSVCPTTLSWFRREENSEADALCNLVQDRHGVVCVKRGRRD